MRIAILNYLYQAGCSTEELVSLYPILRWQAEGLQAAGAEVNVMLHWSGDQRLEHNGISYHFVGDNFAPQLQPWQVPTSLHRAVAAQTPHIVHVHGMRALPQLYFLRKVLPHTCALVVQHHSEQPARFPKRLIQRLCARAASGFLFPAPELAQAWLQTGVIAPHQHIHYMPEASSWVQRTDRQQARARTGMTGGLIFVWVAHLNHGKDPLTVLRGFEQALARVPAIKLYMAHGEDDALLPAVQAHIQNRPALAQSVVLLGEVTRHDLGLYYSSADFFVIGSTRYGGILALTEAMACGLVPVVTDTPFYKAMLQDEQGILGQLWQMGNPDSLAQAIIKAVGQPRDPIAQRAVLAYAQRLSWPTLSHQAMRIYSQILARTPSPKKR